MAGHLSYGIQTSKNLIGTTAAPVTLTTAYTGNTASFITSGVAMVTFYVQYTAQTGGNSIQLKVEGSPTTTNSGTPVFYQDVSSSVTTGTATLTQVEYTFVNAGTTVQRFRIPWPCADQTLKISIKETVGAGTAGTASVAVLIGCND